MKSSGLTKTDAPNQLERADVAIALPGGDKLPDGPLRTFVSSVHGVYDAAGQPAARVIARATLDLPPSIYQSVSHETVSALLRASTVPAWEKVRSVLHVLAALAPFDYNLTDLEKHMSELWQQARRELQEATPLPIDPPPDGSPPPPQPVRPPEPAPLIGVRPAATPGFVGREALIESMREKLSGGPDVRLVLHGPVGAGKTQAVLQYLDRFTGDDRPVWWVRSTTVDSIRASLVELAAALGIERHQRVDRTVRLVLEGLEARRFPFLMVFDELDDPDLLRLTPNGGHLIVTTRDPSLGDDGSSAGLEVPDLEPDEAERLLRDHEPEMSAARLRGLVDTYGRTPLALRQVTAWGRQTGASLDVTDGADPADRLTAAPANDYQRSASLTLLFALDRLEAKSSEALHLLETLACLAPAPISKELLGRGVGGPANPALDGMPHGEMALNKAIAELRRHGLARLADEGRLVEMLPLVRLVQRRALSGAEAARARGRAHALLAAADPGWPDDQQGRMVDIYQQIGEHVEATGLVSSPDLRARQAVYHQVRFRYLAGDHAGACDLGERAYHAWRAGNDPSVDDYLLLRTSQEWANALRAVGRYETAGELTRGAMSQLRVDPSYGESHPYTLAMAGSRAADLRIAGDYRRALEFDQETFGLCRAAYGDDHPRTTMSRHNLAISLRLNGAFEQAETVDRITLVQHRDQFGAGNWRTLLSVNALAEDLNGQGRYQDVLDEVEPMLVSVDMPQRTRMGRGLVLAPRALALARRGIGLVAEALEMLQSSYAECVTLFGERHEYPIALRMTLANTLHLLGRTAEAAEEARQVFESYSRLFGPRNPLTLAADINRANMLRAQGDHASAMRIDGASSETLLDMVGRNHPFSVAAAVNLASDYARDGHPNRLTASRRAFELAQRVYPRLDHPDVIAAELNLTADLATAGVSTAGTRQAQVLQRLEARYGPDHPIVAAVARGERVDCVLEPPLV